MRFKTSHVLLLSLLILGGSVPGTWAQFTNSIQIGGGPLGGIVPNAEPGSFTVLGGGNDIWDTTDEFTFHHFQVDGDFDVRVRVDFLEPVSRYAKAGLMVRETLATDSRMAFSRVAPAGPTLNGNSGAADVSLMYRTWQTSPGANGGRHEDRLAPDPGYPDYKWIRLQREGSLIRGYASTDGLTWNAPQVQDTSTWLSPVGGAPAPFANSALLGFAVSRHQSALQNSVRAEFRAYANVLTDPAAIAEHPQPALALAGQTATFTVVPVGGLDVYAYQWRRDGVDIPGGTNATYTTPTLAVGDDADYSVVITNTLNATTATSSAAHLTVSPAPQLVDASNRGNLVAIYVEFNEPMDPGTALDYANYVITPPVVTNGPLAFLDASQTVVVIPVAALASGSNYTVTVSNVTDQDTPTPSVLSPNPSVDSFTYINYLGTLRHRWSFQTDASDSVAGADGTLANGAVIQDGAVVLDGTDDYVDLPNDLAMAYDSITFEAWATDNGSAGWARVWDFGNSQDGEGNQGGGTSYMFMAWPRGDASLNGLRGAYKLDGASEQLINISPRPALGQRHQIVWTQDAATQTARMYVDGVKVGENTAFTDTPAAVGATFNDWLGRSQFNDPYFKGSITEFRIYDVALSPEFVQGAYLQGPDILPSAGPVRVTQQPSSQTVAELQSVTLQGRVNGAPPYTLQWYRNGVAIAGATNLAYTFPATLADDQAVYRMDASNLFSSTSSTEATLTVTADTQAPTLVSASGNGTLAQVTVRFSEAVNEADATDPFNFAADNGLNVLGAQLVDAQTVLLATAPQTPGTAYTLTINGIRDRSTAQNTIAADSTIGFTAWVYSPGFAVQDLYFGIGGGAVADLTNNPAYPDAPSETHLLNAIEGPVNLADSYGQRISGYLSPEISGDYNFWIASDDASEFYLSTDADPANLQLICFEPTWNGFRAYKNPDRRGSPPENASTTLFPNSITLAAGQKYAFLVLHKEGGGGDNVSLAWQVPGGPEPENNAEPIGGNNICIVANPDTAAHITIINPPQSQSIVINQTVTLSVTATNDQGAPQTYQWLTNGVPVPGANGATFELRITDPAAANTQLTVEAVVSVPGRSVTSNPALLPISEDSTPPTLVSAASVSGTQVGLSYSETVAAATAEDPFNYVVSDAGGLKTVSAVTLRPNGRDVAILLDGGSPVGASFTVEVSGVADLAGNFIAAGAAVDGTQWGAIADIGGPMPPGAHFTSQTGEIEVQAGGADVWGNNDHFTFAYRTESADFDVKAKVSRLDYVGNNWSKAGLNIRSSLDLDSQMVWVYPTPIQGANAFEGAIRFTQGAGVTDFGQPRPPVNELPVWVRVKREGVLFTAYTSRDGENWEAFGSPQAAPQFPQAMLVGVGAVSHVDGTFTTAQFHFEDTFTYPDAELTCSGLNDITIEENHQASASVNVTLNGAPAGLLQYRWYAESAPGSGVFELLDGEYGPGITSPYLTLADNGLRVKAVASVPGQSTECLATITVVGDTNPPVAVSGAGSAGFDQVTVNFDERLDGFSATDPFNYEVSDGVNVLVVDAAALGADERTVTLTLNPATPLVENTDYTVSIFGVQDLANNAVAQPAQVSFRSFVVGCGGLTFEFYSGINGTDIQNLKDAPNFPDRPDSVTFLTSFNSGESLGDNFGGRIRGFFFPPQSGDWIFFMRSDDASQLWLNPNGSDPAGAVLIAEETGCCGNFKKIQSAPIALTANQAYYIEGLYKEGGGGDRLIVAAKLATDPRDPDVDDLVIQGSQIGIPAAPAGILGEVTITQQPLDQTVEENHEVCFTVAGANPMGLPQCYQWYRDGVEIPGATDPTYCTVVNALDDGTQFSASVGIMGSRVSSAPATATVILDTNAPAVIATQPTRRLDQIVLQFDERLDAASATDPFNYFAHAPLSVAGIELSADETAVTITLNQALPPDSTNCVDLTAVSDVAGNPVANGTYCAEVGFYPNYVQQELWYNLGGVAVADLTNNAAYPSAPDLVRYKTSLEANTADEADNYGTRMSGWLKPPVTGDYHFALSSDDASAFYLSTDANPANVQLICFEPTWNGRRDWLGTARRNAQAPENRSTTLFPAGITLTAGELYYFEALMKEGGGGDNLAVTWSIPPQPGIYNEAYGQLPIPGKYIVQLNESLGSSVTITQQPADVTYVFEPGVTNPVTFTAAAEGVLPGRPADVVFQWQRFDRGAWADIPDATGASYSFRPLLPDDGAQFRVVASFPEAQATSTAATLTVVQPNTAPIFVAGPDQLVNQDVGPVTVPGWATGMDVHSFELPAGPVFYSSDFSSPPEDSQVFGDATITDGALQLTTAANGQSGAFYAPAVAVPVKSYTVSLSLLIGGGSEPPADGLSINIANDLPADPQAPGLQAEEGFGTGLSVCFDTYNNVGDPEGEAPAVDLKWRGKTFRSTRLQASQGTNAVYVQVDVRVDANGLASVTYGGTNLFTNVPLPDYHWQSGLQVGLAARTGGSYDNHWVDDLLISAIPYDLATPERSQALTFVLSNSAPALFAAQPAINPSGTLTFTPAPGAYGSAQVTVSAQDDGGTDNGGTDSSTPATFAININAAPVVSFLKPAPNSTFVVPQDIEMQLLSSDPDGTVDQVEIYSGANRLATLTGTDLFVWMNVLPGDYTLQAVATDNLGHTGLSSVVNITMLPNPPIPPNGITVLDTSSPRVRQTGLYYQSVVVTNPTPLDFNAVLLLVTNTPPDPAIVVWNATGLTNGVPYILFNHDITAFSSVTFEIEFYSTNRRAVPNPTYGAVLVPAQEEVAPEGTALTIDRQELLTDGSFLLEFSSLSNRTYYIQYRSDVLGPWTTAQPALIGNGTRQQWIDSGPPKTASPPSSVPQRMYQIILLP